MMIPHDDGPHQLLDPSGASTGALADPNILGAPGHQTQMGGQAVEQLAGHLLFNAQRMQMHADVANMTKGLADFRLNQTQALQQHQGDWQKQLYDDQQAGPPEPLTHRYLDQFDQSAKAFMDSQPASVQNYAGEHLAAMREQFGVNAMQAEQTGIARQSMEALTAPGGTIDKLGGALYLDDSQLHSAIGEATAAIHGSALPADKKAELAAQTNQRLTSTAMQGLITRDPDAAKAELSGGGLDGLLGMEGKTRLLAAADQEIARRDAEAERAAREQLSILQAQVRMRLGDHMAAIADRGTGIGVTQQEIQAAFPDQAPQIMKQIGDAQTFYQARQQVGLSTPAEDAALMAKYRPDGDGYAEQASRRDSLAQAIQSKNAALAKDPTAYVLSTSPAARQSLQAAQADPAKLPQALAVMDDMQARLGVPDYARTVLAKPQAQDLAAKISAMKPEQAANAMAGMASQYGASWPGAFRDMAGAGLPAGYKVLATVDDPIGRVKLAEALSIPRKELREAAGYAATEVDKSVPEALAPFAKTLALAPNGQAVAAQYQEAAKALAYHLSATMDGDAAAQTAVHMLVNGKYDYASGARYNARTPKGSLGQMERLADSTLAALKPEHLMPPNPGASGKDLTSAQLQSAALSAAQRGQWVTNPADDGWVLLDSLRQPVRTRDGGPVQVKFTAAGVLPSGIIPTAPASTMPAEASLDDAGARRFEASHGVALTRGSRAKAAAGMTGGD